MYRRLLFLFVILIGWQLAALSAFREGWRRSVSGGVPADTALIDRNITLGEVVVVGRRKLIELNNDTTLINTSGLQIHRGANLEALIKKIPGMSYDRESKQLSFNGKVLNGVNINGETFMGNDIASALENLPADAVELLKLYNMLSELEKMTGVDDGAEDFVLDIKTKDSYNGSLVGSLAADHGSRGKRLDEAQANVFNAGGENLSLVGRSDNLSSMDVGRGNFQNMLMGNVVKKLGKRLTLTGSISTSTFHNETESRSYDEQYLASGTKYQESSALMAGKNRSDFANFSLKYKIDDRTLLNISANGSRAHTTGSSATTTELYEKGSAIDSLTSSTLQTSTGGRATSYYLSADFTRRLNKAGTSISLKADANGNSDHSDNLSLSQTRYHRLAGAAGGDSLLLRHLYQLTPSHQRNSRVSLLFTQPLGKLLRLQAGYGLVYRKTTNARDSYDYGAPMRPRVDSLAGESRLATRGQELTLRMDYKGRRWTVNGGLVVEWQRRSIGQRQGFRSVDSTLRAVEYKPTATAKWRKGKVSVEMRYDGYTTQPSLSALLTPVDVSNPLSVRVGNPELKPSYRQRLDVRVEHEKYGLTLSGNYSNTFNDFAEEVSYDNATGARTYRTVNINGNRTVEGSLLWQKQLGVFLLSGAGHAFLRHDVALSNESSQSVAARSETRTVDGSANLWCSYQPKWGYVGLTADWRLSRSHNRLTDTRVNSIDYGAGISGDVELPWGFEVRTDASCRLRRGTYATAADDQWLWNMTVAWSFLRQRQATLSCTWNDILSRRNDINRSVSAYSYHEIYRPQIRSYVLFSLKYRFNITRKQ